MIFNSIDFLAFFAVLFAVYFFVPDRFKWVLLLAASYYFYGYLGPQFLAFLITPTILVYFIALKISNSDSPTQRKYLLLSGLFFALAVLLVFKYTNFAGRSLFTLAGLFIKDLQFKPLDLLVPIGVSFFSFKLVSYLMDVYNQNAPAEKHAGYFALYVSFFPQILAGPIDRAVNFIPELKKNIPFDIDRIVSGLRLTVWGLFKKMVIADRLALFVDELFKNPENQGLNLVFGAYFYAFQIYCDFSGYSDMAIGISRILGFKSMRNFNFPYFSKSFTQFWNNWHISLSTWLRDYLFLPIAYAVMRPVKGNKWLGIKVDTLGYVVGMFITMFLGGLWHGASWTFVAWGVLHGIYLIVGYTTKKKRKRWIKKIKLNKLPRLHHLLAILLTFNMTSLAWIFFRAGTFEQAFQYIRNISLTPAQQGTGYLVYNLVLIGLFIIMEILYKNRDKIHVFKRIPAPVKVAGFALFICMIIILAVDTSNEFIYFKF